MEQTFTNDKNISKVQQINSMKECIDNCLECFRICSRMINHCLEMGGEHAEARHISLLNTCAIICETSAKFMLAQSEFHHDTCRVCADVCKACADDCERISSEDEMMNECIEICRRCASSCEKMATH